MAGELLTGAGAIFSIGTSTAATIQSEFEADTYTAIGELESIDEISRERNPVEFASLQDRRTRVARGVEAVSIISGTYAHDAADDGQAAMTLAYETVSLSADNFNFRIQFADGPGPDATTDGTTLYFRGPVLKLSLQSIDNQNVIRRAFSIARNSEWIEVESAASTA